MTPIIANALNDYMNTGQGFVVMLIVVFGSFFVFKGAELLWKAYLERKLPLLAERFGLTYKRYGGEGSTTLTGHYRSQSVYVYEEVRGWGRYKRTHSIYQVKLNHTDVPAGLVVFREGLAAKAEKILGIEDIQIGREKIDRRFIIQGAFTEDCQEFFARPGVADYFVELHKMCRDFRLEHNLLILDFDKGIAIRRDEIQPRLEALTRCAHAIAQTDPRRKTVPTEPRRLHPEPIDPFAPPVTSRSISTTPQDNTDGNW